MVVRLSGVGIGCLLVFDWLSVALVRLLVCLGFVIGLVCYLGVGWFVCVTCWWFLAVGWWIGYCVACLLVYLTLWCCCARRVGLVMFAWCVLRVVVCYYA